MSREIVISVATDGQSRAVHGFLFGAADPHLRQRTPQDVRSLVDRRLVLVAKFGRRLIAGCYIDDSEERPEYGGAFTDPAARGKGLGLRLGRAAILNYRIMGNYKSSPFMAHVHVQNTAPLGILDALGFVLDSEDEGHAPDSIPGIEHMPRGNDGLVHARTYRLPEAKLRSIAEAALSDDIGKRVNFEGSPRAVVYRVPSHANGGALLREWLKQGKGSRR